MDCREADLDTLLAELTLYRLDLMISERSILETAVWEVATKNQVNPQSVFFATEALQAQL